MPSYLSSPLSRMGLEWSENTGGSLMTLSGSFWLNNSAVIVNNNRADVIRPVSGITVDPDCASQRESTTACSRKTSIIVGDLLFFNEGVSPKRIEFQRLYKMSALMQQILPNACPFLFTYSIRSMNYSFQDV